MTTNMLDMTTCSYKELRDINDQKDFSKAEAGQILTEAQVPYLVIDSILNLEEQQRLRQGSDTVERVQKD